MLQASDLYDFYGLSMLTEQAVSGEGRKLYNFFLGEIRTKYIKTLSRRIKEEAGYIGLDVEGTNIATLLKKVNDGLAEQIQKQAERMRRGLGGFDMSFIKNTYAAAVKPKGMENAADAFRSKQGTSRSMFGGEPWAKICDAFVGIEKAQSSKEIVLAIDHLNALQHNCCHVIFDLTGTRGGGGSTHDDVKAVLDEKFKAKTPKEFASKMSEDVRNFLKEQGVL